MPATSPVCTYDVLVPMFVVRTDHVPEPILYSIMYPVTEGLPLFNGAVQESCTLDREILVTLRPVGVFGKAEDCGIDVGGGVDVGGGTEVLVGVAETSGEGLLSVPPVKIAT
ncbi:MAG TPA: hypothetical protein VKB83_03800, partial [Nitrosopumilaceae archaeon]|nr:hypothetical protein [Nitrosopumilaceae archaeon]